MQQVEFAAILIVPVDDANKRLPVVCQAVQQLLFDLVKLAGRNFVVLGGIGQFTGLLLCNACCR